MGKLVAPSQGRGLKQHPRPRLPLCACRPLTGARIETRDRLKKLARDHVAPSQGRGLKHLCDLRQQVGQRVAPSQGRGLKRARLNVVFHFQIVAPSQGRGLKPFRESESGVIDQSPPHRGAD